MSVFLHSLPTPIPPFHMIKICSDGLKFMLQIMCNTVLLRRNVKFSVVKAFRPVAYQARLA